MLLMPRRTISNIAHIRIAKIGWGLTAGWSSLLGMVAKGYSLGIGLDFSSSESSHLILRVVRGVPLLLSSVPKRAAIAFRTAPEQWHTGRITCNDALSFIGSYSALKNRFDEPPGPTRTVSRRRHLGHRPT